MCSFYQEFVLTKVIFITTASKGTGKVCISVHIIRSVRLNHVRTNEVPLYSEITCTHLSIHSNFLICIPISRIESYQCS